MSEIALFPLNTLLFPGGLLPLRIFEPRYVDMIGRCMREDDVFGVVLVRDGSDTDREVDTAPVGTSARIVDFQSLEDGLLGVLCHGQRRFRIRARTRRADGLNCAEVDWLEDPQGVPIPETFQPLVPLLRTALAQLKTMSRFMTPDYEDACWVAYRIAELLPLDRALMQRLLEIDDPIARLGMLAPLFDLHD
jgi:uncharacterized protein